MILHMRTSILIDDRLGKAARMRARKEGTSFSAVVSRALEVHLALQPTRAEAPPFRLVTVGGGGPRPGIDLDRTSALVTDDDETAFHQGARKR